MANEVSKKAPVAPSISFTENPLVESENFSERIGLSINTYATYLKMMVDPNENLFYYGFNTIPLKKVTNPSILFYLLILLGFLFVGILLYKKNKLIIYGYLFFGFSLLYAANLLVPVSGIVANRYAFIASLGFSIFIISIIDVVLNHLLAKVNREDIQKSKPKIISILLLFVCFIYAIYTYSRNDDWKNTYTLFKADMPRLLNSFEANRIAVSNVLYAGLNNQDKEQKNLLVKEALQYGLNAQKLYNKNPYINEKVGLAYQTLGQWEAAKSSYLLNTNLEHDRPLSWEYLGDIYFTKDKNFDSAAITYLHAIKLEPTYDTPYFKYLNSNYRSGKKEETYNYFREMEKNQPKNWIPTQCIGYYYLFEMDTLKGMQHIKMSFEKGFKDSYTAEYVKENLIRFGDIEGAEKMNQFIQ
jgi:lipoprotein NlpI